jgi:hypothetical protein
MDTANQGYSLWLLAMVQAPHIQLSHHQKTDITRQFRLTAQAAMEGRCIQLTGSLIQTQTMGNTIVGLSPRSALKINDVEFLIPGLIKKAPLGLFI